MTQTSLFPLCQICQGIPTREAVTLIRKKKKMCVCVKERQRGKLMIRQKGICKSVQSVICNFADGAL